MKEEELNQPIHVGKNNSILRFDSDGSQPGWFLRCVDAARIYFVRSISHWLPSKVADSLLSP